MNIFVNGRDYDRPGDGPRQEITNPVTAEVLGRVPVAQDAAAAETVLDLAEAGLREWSSLPLWKRADVVHRFAGELESRGDEIADLMARNMGRAIRECRAEVDLTVVLARAFAERAKHLYGEVFPDSQPGLEGDLVFTRREPLGVFLSLVPFNAPVELYVHKVIPALLMGNAVIVKPPMPNPLCHFELTDMLVRAGVPREAVQLVYAEGEFIAEHLTRSPRIAAVTFTGSTATGTAVNKDGAAELHRMFLELGGNDAFIVVEGADLDLAADEVVRSRMMNSGQVCCSSKRTLVPESVADEFEAKVLERLEKLVQGDPLDPSTELGSLVNADAARKVQAQVDATLEEGARCRIGGRIKDEVFFEPTLLVDIDPSMQVASDLEIFGPVISVLRYRTVDEAVRIANQSEYGLQASVLAGDMAQAMAVAARLDVGMVVVNGAGSYRHIDMPFGGTKKSGIGTEGVSSTLEEFSQVKSFVMKGVFG